VWCELDRFAVAADHLGLCRACPAESVEDRAARVGSGDYPLAVPAEGEARRKAPGREVELLARASPQFGPGVTPDGGRGCPDVPVRADEQQLLAAGRKVEARCLRGRLRQRQTLAIRSSEGDKPIAVAAQDSLAVGGKADLRDIITEVEAPAQRPQ